ncbi:MAG: TerB family tellurite resistance protein [Candidatus Schekmanbacteria bacterium]|nr:TerB family tellurite resistance protein [Candidatus Schekmanbacteria bacterium]
MGAPLPRFKGKLIGAGLGVLLGGPVGAIIGVVIGHLVGDLPGDFKEAKERQYHRVHYSRKVYNQPGYGEFIFVSNLVALLTAVAKADGEIAPEEVAVIRRFFQVDLGYRGEELMLIKKLIKESIHTDLDVDRLCHEFRRSSNYQSRLMLLELLYKVAQADPKKTRQSEQILINKIAELLGVLPADHQRVVALMQVKEPDDGHYKILGVDSDTSVEEIKKAYRRLVQQNHPDKVNHLGEEYVKIAHQQLTRINQAYDSIKREKGF